VKSAVYILGFCWTHTVACKFLKINAWKFVSGLGHQREKKALVHNQSSESTPSPLPIKFKPQLHGDRTVQGLLAVGSCRSAMAVTGNENKYCLGGIF
jgi:hypothetical protein